MMFVFTAHTGFLWEGGMCARGGKEEKERKPQRGRGGWKSGNLRARD